MSDPYKDRARLEEFLTVIPMPELQEAIDGMLSARLDQRFDLLEKFLIDNRANPYQQQLVCYQNLDTSVTYVLADRKTVEAAVAAETPLPIEDMKSRFPFLSLKPNFALNISGASESDK
jgi:hypothetical protein